MRQEPTPQNMNIRLFFENTIETKNKMLVQSTLFRGLLKIWTLKKYRSPCQPPKNRPCNYLSQKQFRTQPSVGNFIQKYALNRPCYSKPLLNIMDPVHHFVSSSGFHLSKIQIWQQKFIIRIRIHDRKTTCKFLSLSFQLTSDLDSFRKIFW